LLDVRHPQDSEASGIHRVAYTNVNNTCTTLHDEEPENLEPRPAPYCSVVLGSVP
jgi:hypothetical protein